MNASGNASKAKADRRAIPRDRLTPGTKTFAAPTPLRVVLLMGLGLAGSLIFDAISIPQASASSPYAANNHSSRTSRSLIQRNLPAVDEFTIGKRVTHLTQTTKEIHTILDALPGPGLPDTRTTTVSPPHSDPYEEMAVRLRHATTLVREITTILIAMPSKAASPAAASISPQPPKAQPQPAAPETRSLPAIPEEIALPSATEAATINANKKSAASSPLSTTTLTRLAILLLGALFAVGLIKYTPRLFRAKNGDNTATLQPRTKTIEPPPLTDHALELADIMASMGLTDGAAHALVEHIRKNPKQALSYWLKLLAVYRQAGKQTEFEQTAELMRTNYNIQPGSWGADGDTNLSPASLEHYPHIAAQLQKLWPRPESSDYLLGLLADNRDGRREGFPLPVVEEIVLLLAVLRAGNDD